MKHSYEQLLFALEIRKLAFVFFNKEEPGELEPEALAEWKAKTYARCVKDALAEATSTANFISQCLTEDQQSESP